MKPWKEAEKQAARVLGGKRKSRGDNFSQEAPDVVDNPLFSIECKYRKQLPKLLTDGIEQAKKYIKRRSSKIPILFLKQRNQKGGYVVLEAEDFKRILEGQTEEGKQLRLF